MLPPDYYEDCADDIVELYSQFDEAVISDITRRIVKTGTVTETAKGQIRQAQEMGLLYSDILQEIAKRTDATTAIVKALFEDAGVKAVKIDGEAYRKAGKVPVDIRQSPAMLQVLEAGYKKTLGNMKNLTLTTANTSQTAYINACNSAYMKVSSGAFSYQEAIKQAIQETAQHGTTVLYPSGHTDRIDVAVRRSVMTGLGQTCRQISLTNAEEMDCDLLEISAHSGARPSHAVWQGQIVSRSGRQGYLSLSDIGFGTGEGFGGWNCQHDWYPYFEGISTRNYTQAELDALNEKSIEYNGKMYTEYEISQIQRRYEREIRAAKREQAAYKTAVEESNGELKEVMQTALTHSNSVVKDKQAKMREFIRQTGQQRDYFREQNYGSISVVKGKAKEISLLEKILDKFNKKSIISVNDCGDYDKLEKYLKKEYGISMSPMIKKLDINPVKQALSGIEAMMKEFPELAESIRSINVSDKGIMSCFDGVITFNPEYYKDNEYLLKLCDESTQSRWWVKGASPASLGVHEATHQIEWIIDGLIYKDNEKRVIAWDECTEAKKIVEQACHNIRATSYGKEKDKNMLIKEISRYAQESPSETLAEAFADVFSCGENVSPLAIEIRKLTVEKLKSLRK